MKRGNVIVYCIKVKVGCVIYGCSTCIILVTDFENARFGKACIAAVDFIKQVET